MQRADCAKNCWNVGAIAGLVVLLFTSVIGETGWLGGLFLAAVTCVLLGGLLQWLLVDGQPLAYEPDLPARPTTVAPVRIAKAAAEAPIAPQAAQQEAAPQVVETSDDRPETVVITEAPVSVSKPKAAKPRRGKRDDLKQISGIGPKIEKALNELGVTRYAQIADWTSTDEDDIAKHLGRSGGRVKSENWVAQARDLSKAGGRNG